MIAMDPKDARGYVCLGKLLVEDGREEEAARLYDVGCQALGGTSAFIWQARERSRASEHARPLAQGHEKRNDHSDWIFTCQNEHSTIHSPRP